MQNNFIDFKLLRNKTISNTDFILSVFEIIINKSKLKQYTRFKKNGRSFWKKIYENNNYNFIFKNYHLDTVRKYSRILINNILDYSKAINLINKYTDYLNNEKFKLLFVIRGLILYINNYFHNNVDFKDFFDDFFKNREKYEMKKVYNSNGLKKNYVKRYSQKYLMKNPIGVELYFNNYLNDPQKCKEIFENILKDCIERNINIKYDENNYNNDNNNNDNNNNNIDNNNENNIKENIKIENNNNNNEEEYENEEEEEEEEDDEEDENNYEDTLSNNNESEVHIIDYENENGLEKKKKKSFNKFINVVKNHI